MRSVLSLTLAAPTAARFLASGNATVPSSESVKLDGADVYSQNNGHAILNQCQWIQHGVSDDPSKPVFEVCGSSTQVTVYLRGECEEYYEYTAKIGNCDAKAGTVCVTHTPASLGWTQTAQSYKISSC